MYPPETPNDEDFYARINQDNGMGPLQVYSPGQATTRNSVNGGDYTPPVRKTPSPYKTAIEHNIAARAASQKNTAMGSGILITNNEAYDEGTIQTNSASTCVMM